MRTGAGFRSAVDDPAAERLHVHTGRELFGAADDASVEAVTLAVMDLPYGAVRRHLRAGTDPGRYREQILAAVRGLLATTTHHRVVLMSFPDEGAFRELAESPDYKEIAVHRKAGTTGVVLLAKGIVARPINP